MADPEQWKVSLLAVSIAGASLSTLFFLLRLYSRHLTTRYWDSGDYFLGLGLLFCYGISICTIMIAYNGIGQDIWSLPRETRGRATLLFWITQKFWPLAQLCVKVSIIILLRRLLGTVSYIRLTTTILLALTIAWAISAIVSNTLQCIPPQYFWIKSIEGRCLGGYTILFITIGLFSLLEDIVLLLIPVIAVWRMKMALQQKVQITLLFSGAGLVCIFSLLRLVEFPNYKTGNLTQSGGLETIWTLCELYLAIICASLVLMRPVMQACIGSVRSFASRGTEEKATRPPSDIAQLFPEFVYFTNTSQDAYSEVRSKAYRVPSKEAPRPRSLLAMGDIMVQTSIDRDVQDREEILAAIADGSSLAHSTWAAPVMGSRPGSRMGSVASVQK